MMGFSDIWPICSRLSSAVMVFGGIVPYIPQYLQIKRTSNAEGFSTWVCLVLLVANILRIFFWCGKFFELPLLLQSFITIGAMLAMLNLCCSTQNANRANIEQRRFKDFKMQHFWDWSRFEDYVQFCAAMMAAGALLTYLLRDIPFCVEGVGLLALLMEAMLGLPQFLQNRKNQSCQGMSLKMVLMWAIGDSFKTAYFVLNQTPLQFWLCGGVQMALDAAILAQVYYYRPRTETKSR